MDIKRLQQFGTLKSYKCGHVLYKVGDTDPGMYIILKGKASLRHKVGERVECEVMGAGKFFGEISVILNIPKMHTCIIEEDGTTMICIQKSSFEDFIKEDSEFSLHVMASLCRQWMKVMSEREDFSIRLRKYEPATDDEVDMTTSLQALKERPPEISKIDAPLLDAMKSLIQTGTVLPAHGSYSSKNWPNAIAMISPKAIKCPVCGKSFTTTYLSKSRLGSPTTGKDMRKTYKDIEPIYFDLYSCSKCGYTNYSEDFDKIRPAQKQRLEKDLEGLTELPLDMDENIFDINYVFLKLYLAIFCAQNMGGKVIAIPKSWLRLHWLYEDVDENELALQAAKNAYDGYMDLLYNTKIFTGENEMEVMLLMGELAIKQGMDKDAAKLFWEVLHSNSVNDMQRKRAENRLYDIRYKDEADA